MFKLISNFLETVLVMVLSPIIFLYIILEQIFAPKSAAKTGVIFPTHPRLSKEQLPLTQREQRKAVRKAEFEQLAMRKTEKAARRAEERRKIRRRNRRANARKEKARKANEEKAKIEEMRNNMPTDIRKKYDAAVKQARGNGRGAIYAAGAVAAMTAAFVAGEAEALEEKSVAEGYTSSDDDFAALDDSFYSSDSGSIFDDSSSSCINPSTGLPMVDDICGGIDVGGNMWGDSDSMFDSDFDSGMDDSSMFDASSGFDDSFSSGFDDISSFDSSFDDSF